MTLILDALGDDFEVSQMDLVTRTGLPKSTVHRTVKLLVAHGWLQQLGDRYRLGRRLFELGGRVASTAHLREVAVPYLEDLYEATHEIVNLGVLDGSSIIFVDKIGSHRRIDTPARPGSRFPANCTAMGKVIGAFGTERVVEQILGDLTSRTPNSIARGDQFLKELTAVRRRGYAIDNGEFDLAMRCCAAPIRGSGNAIAAVSVTGPKERIDPKKIGPLVVRAATGIGRAYLG
jgi:DNA-binding IclR family transcriptional regulator